MPRTGTDAVTETGWNSAASSHDQVGRFTLCRAAGARVHLRAGDADLRVGEVGEDLWGDGVLDVGGRGVALVHPEDGLVAASPIPGGHPRSTYEVPPVALAGLVLVEVLVGLAVDVTVTLLGVPLVARRAGFPGWLQSTSATAPGCTSGRTSRAAGSRTWTTSRRPPTCRCRFSERSKTTPPAVDGQGAAVGHALDSFFGGASAYRPPMTLSAWRAPRSNIEAIARARSEHREASQRILKAGTWRSPSAKGSSR